MERRIFKDNLKLGQRSRETLKMNGEYIYIKNSCFATRRIFRGVQFRRAKNFSFLSFLHYFIFPFFRLCNGKCYLRICNFLRIFKKPDVNKLHFKLHSIISTTESQLPIKFFGLVAAQKTM